MTNRTRGRDTGRKARSKKAANQETLFVHNKRDPGDATARNYRYQHSYGVILIVAARSGALPYVSIWCEHHEDFLAERFDGKFDAYQIKTRRPENGPWTLADVDLIRAISRFVGFVSEYGDKIAEIFFVSNCDFDEVTEESGDEWKRGRSPKLFLNHVRACDSPDQITDPFLRTFNDLQARCACSKEELFAALKLLNLKNGPSRTDFESAISNVHLGNLSECRHLPVSRLNELRDRLVALVYRASSLQIDDPAMHVRSLIQEKALDPTVGAKRIVIAEVSFDTNDVSRPGFVFPGKPQVKLGAERRPGVLELKLKRGGLDLEVEYMKQMERAAEYNLMEDVQRRPERYPQLQTQVEQMVLQECGEAYLRARSAGEPFGSRMLIDVQNRLRVVAEERPEMVGYQSYECLIGVAALLTSDCLVWWSSRFPLMDLTS